MSSTRSHRQPTLLFLIILSIIACLSAPACLYAADNHAPVAGYGWALEFTGENQYLYANYAPPVPDLTQALTAAFWVRVNKIEPGRKMYFINNYDETYHVGFKGYINGDASIHFKFGNNPEIATSANVLKTGEWQHVAITGTTSSQMIYVNGEVQANRTGSFGWGSAAGHCYLVNNYFNQGTLNGAIDAISLWDKALDGAAILDLVYGGITPGQPEYAHLVGYWRLDEGLGSVALDATGKGNATLGSHKSGTPLPAWIPSGVTLTFVTADTTPVGGFLLARDADGDSLTYSLTAGGSQGTVTLTDPQRGAFTYTPALYSSGPDSFAFKVNDGRLDSNIATVTVTVYRAAPDPGGDVTVVDPGDPARPAAIVAGSPYPAARPNIRLVVPILQDPQGTPPTSIRILTVTGGRLALVTETETPVPVGEGAPPLALSENYVDLKFTPDPDRETDAYFTYAVVDPQDEAHHSAPSQATIPIIPAGPPVLQLSEELAANGREYREGSGPLIIDPGLTVAAGARGSLAGATVAITDNFFPDQDSLGLNEEGKNGQERSAILSNYDAATGALTLTGPASPEAYQAVLSSLTYSNSSKDPAPDPRTVTFIVYDGYTYSSPVSCQIRITAMNDHPGDTPGDPGDNSRGADGGSGGTDPATDKSGGEPKGGPVAVEPDPGAIQIAPGNFLLKARETSREGVVTLTCDAGKLAALVSRKGREIDTYTLAGREAADGFVARIPAIVLEQMARQNPAASLELQAALATWRLPVRSLDVSTIAGSLGTNLDNLFLDFRIQRLSLARVLSAGAVEQGRAEPGLPTSGDGRGELLAGPVFFAVQGVDGSGQSIALPGFPTYTSRSINLAGTPDPEAAAAVLYDPVRRDLRPVPVVFTFTEGRAVAVVKHRGNGIYFIFKHHQAFPDLADHWARRDVAKLASRLIVAGREKQNFDPEEPVTRAEFTALLVRALGLSGGETGAEKANLPDVTGHWAAAAINTGAAAGLVQGYDDGTFRPDAAISRQEIAALLVRAIRYASSSLVTPGGAVASAPVGSSPIDAGDAGIINPTRSNPDYWNSASPIRYADAGIGAGIDITKPGGLLPRFSDSQEIAPWAREAVAISIAAGIIHSDTQDRLKPGNSATRAEAAVMLARTLKLLQLIN
ncbi:S-layer homology domain-containing protein [Moorella naiadis]|uniref:S-layer homology domain-containing protein n=1 Tax=Moorella naiadis (nom. illeg.) TaxID=3093670 RepID=UPI003D9CAAE8